MGLALGLGEVLPHPRIRMDGTVHMISTFQKILAVCGPDGPFRICVPEIMDCAVHIGAVFWKIHRAYGPYGSCIPQDMDHVVHMTRHVFQKSILSDLLRMADV